MFHIKDAEIKDEEAEMVLQNRKWCHCVPRLLANLIRENKMVSAGAAINVASRYIEIITRAQQQRNATATQFDSSDFFVRRLEEYEGTLIVQTTRNSKNHTHKKLTLSATYTSDYTSCLASWTSYDLTGKLEDHGSM